MVQLLPYTAHFIDGQLLDEPVRVYLDCATIKNMYQEVYRVFPDVNPSFVETCCVKVVEDGAPVPAVIGSALCDIPAFVIVYNNQLLGNKYFTKELFLKYKKTNCCNCEITCDDTCFLLLNNCKAEINGKGLLI